MNCDIACHLIDDYLEKRLSRYAVRRLEQHLSLCTSCAQELRDRPLFERAIRQSLAVSVQQRQLSAEASMRIVQAAQSSTRRAVWSNLAYRLVRMGASAAAVGLVMVGLFFLLRGIPGKSNANTITLQPVRQLAPSDQQPEDPPGDPSPALSLGYNDVLIEPWTLKPGETFTITLFLQTNLPQPIDTARFDIGVNGPTGYYSFELTVKGRLPSHGVSVLQITPDVLAAYSREKYLMSPAEILGEPGVYTVSIYLYSPVWVSTD
jgi:hypothetical protein